MLSRIHSYAGSPERKRKWCRWWQRLFVWHPCSSDLSAAEWICTQRTTVHGCEVIKGCRYNQPQSSALDSNAVRVCESLFFHYTPSPLLTERQRSWEKLQTAVLGCNKAVVVLPWKPWRNLDPSGSSSGVYSLYPPTKSWLKTLRPNRGPGDDAVLLRCPSSWERYIENVNTRASVGGSVGASFI